MTDAYSNLNTTFDQNYAVYAEQNYKAAKRMRNTAAFVGSAALGFVGGTGVVAGVDYIKNNRPVKGDCVSEPFAQKVFKKYVDKGYAAKGKEFFRQKAEVVKKLCSVRTPEEFQKLLKKNRKYSESLCDGISLDSMCEMVNKDNIKNKVSALKKRINNSIDPEMQNIKDSIKLCWDKTKKKFVKTKEVEDRLYNIIKKTPREIRWGRAFKYGGITAGIMGVVALIMNAASNRVQEVRFSKSE